jgi:hypothetical protein
MSYANPTLTSKSVKAKKRKEEKEDNNIKKALASDIS